MEEEIIKDVLNQIKKEKEKESNYPFTISEPTKKPSEGVQLSYWVYKITVGEKFVFRRFSDFEWLNNCLELTELGCIIPALPEKDILGNLDKVLNIDSKQLLEYRQRALAKFLSRIFDHPKLKESKYFKMFLELNDQEFNVVKQDKIQPKVTSSWSFFRKVISKEEDLIIEAKKIVNQLDLLYKTLKQKLTQMIETRKLMSKSISEFTLSFQQLGLLEKSIEQGPLSNTLLELSNKSQEVSISMLSQSERENIKIIETLHYYQGIILSIQKQFNNLELLRYQRDEATVTRQNLEKYKKVETELQLQKAKELESSYESLYQSCLENFKNDYTRFHQERKIDFRVMILEFVLLQSDYASSCEKSWDSLIPSLKNINKDLFFYY